MLRQFLMTVTLIQLCVICVMLSFCKVLQCVGATGDTAYDEVELLCDFKFNENNFTPSIRVNFFFTSLNLLGNGAAI